MGGRMREARHYARAVLLLLGLAACGRATGCSGCDQEGEPFPHKDRVHSAVQVRVTEDGLAFLEENLEPLLAQAIPEGLNVCVPGQSGDIIGLVQWGICQNQCPNGEMGCPVDISIGSIDLVAVEPASIRALVRFENFGAEFDVAAEPVVDCRLSISGPGFPVQVDLALSTPEPTRDLTFAITNPTYRLADLDIRLRGEGGGLSFLCDAIDGVINFPFIGDFILDVLQSFIEGPLTALLAGFVDDFTCRTCEAEDDCPVDQAAHCVDGRCMAGDACVPAPLGIEGRLDVGELLSGFSPGLEAAIDYLATPGSYVQVENGGLSMGVISGALSPRNRCVPPRPRPALAEPPRAESLRTNVAPDGFSYEVGLGISDTIVRHFLWAFFNSGSLCLALTSDTIEQLNVGILGIALPDLRRLARNPDAPVAITLSPQAVPIATFGSNTIVPDPDDPGQRVLDDPLLTLEIPDLWLDFHVFMEERWVRVFSLSADVTLPVGVAFTPENQIIPVLGDLGGALTNVRAHDGDIMRDDPARLAGLLPVLLRPLSSLVADRLVSPIQLPDIMGYRLDMQDGSLRGIEENTFLGVFANLRREEVGAEGEGAAFSVDTAVEILEIHVPPTAEFVIDAPDAWRRPFLRVAVEAWDGTVDDAEMEYSWRVDEGTWSLFTPAEEMVIRDPVLLLQGRHRLQVRARRADDYRTLDPTPATVEFLIDSVPPALELAEADDGGVRVDVSDLVSAADRIEVLYRLDGGPWTALEGAWIDAAGAGDVEVRAVDEAGNVAEATLQRSEKGLIGRPPPDRRGGGGGGCGGCAVSGPGGSSLPALLLLAAVGLLRRRRRLRRALFAGLVVLGCSDDSRKADGGEGADAGPPDAAPSGCAGDEDCDANQACRDGECVVVTCQDDPSLCDRLSCDTGEPARCTAMGVCECEPFCPGGCGDGEYCCFAENACRPVPEACADVQCDPGFDLRVTEDGTVDERSCALEGAQCDCIEREPLEPGVVGRYSDFVIADDTAWFSAYADTYGDLVVGRYVPDEGFRWWWVDGVPADGEVVAGPSGPRGGVEGPGDDVGLYTAIAAGPEGELHVAYHDATNRALKYALGVPREEEDGFDWTVRTLDVEGDAGRWASISVNARGVPGIAYRVARVRGADGWASEVRYVLARNARPAGEADWNPPFTLQRVLREEPCGGACPAGEVCVVETDTCGRLTRGDCGECADGTRCVEGACQATADIPPPPGTYPEGTGLFTSQTRDRDGLPVVAWYDRTSGALWMSRFVDAGFTEPEMLAGWGHPDPDRDGDMGTNVDVATDADGNVHLCYQDGMTDSLRYLAPALDRDEWVDDGARILPGAREYAVHVVGEDCNLRFDPAGDPIIVYQDASAHDILLARRAGDGAWVRHTLRGAEPAFEGSFGFYTRARVAGAALWVSSYFYDNQGRPYAEGLDVFTVDLD